MHINEGKIKTYLDGELSPQDQSQVKAHLDECRTCQSKSQELRARSQRISHQLQTLDPTSSESSPAPSRARTRLDSYPHRKVNENMFNKLFTKKYQPLWVGVTLVALLAIALTVPQVRAFANSFLGLFRVEQFSVVQVNPAAISENLGSSAQFEALLSKNVQVTEDGEAQEVSSLDQAAELAGFQPRLPASFKGEAQLMITPATNISFQVDLKLVQGILDELELKDVDLPASLDGQTVSANVQSGVTAALGDCQMDPDKVAQEGFDPDSMTVLPLPHCTTFVQMPSPDVNAPPGLDITKMGEAYLQLLGMSPEEAAQFSSHIDWTTTLVIPIPVYGTQYQEVPVDGVTGTLILSEGDTSQYLLMWVKDGMIYALGGPGDRTTALNIATSIE